MFLGCSNSNPSGPSGPSGPVVGWHDAGLVLSAADQSAGGVQWLSSVGNRIIASTASGEVFLGQQGSTHWDSVPFPGNDLVYTQTSIDSSVYFGTRTTGQLWQLTFPGKTWTNMSLGLSGKIEVDYITSWRGEIATSTFNLTDASVGAFWGHANSWTDISRGWLTNGDDATTAIGIDSMLFAATYSDGLLRRSFSDSSWSQVPNPIVPILQANNQFSPGTLDKPRSLAWYHGNLWVGYLIWGQIVHTIGIDTPWIPTTIDSGKNPGRNLPQDIMTLFVWNDRLFAGGQSTSTPMVLKEGVGWEYLSQNWGGSDNGSGSVCSVDITLAFAAIGDTLYAAGCGHVFKLPWSLVPQ